MHFLTLPSRVSSHLPACDGTAYHPQAQLPEYYAAIKLPIAIDTIEVRPSRHMIHITATLRLPHQGQGAHDTAQGPPPA